jgi:O-antigen ligase
MTMTPATVAGVSRTTNTGTVQPTRFATPRWVDLLVFLFLMSGPPQLRVRDATASLRGETDAAILFRLAVWGCGALWIGVRLYPLVVDRGILPRIDAPQVMGGLLLIVLSTGIWIAPGPALTAFSIFQLAVMMGFALVFVRLYGPETYTRYLFIGLLLLALAIICAWILTPEMVVRRGRLRGDLIAPAGAVAVLGITLALSGALKFSRATLHAVVGVFVVLLIAAQTRTAFAAILPCLVLAWMFRYPVPMKRVLPLAVVILIASTLVDKVAIGKQYVIREEQSLATMSDRIPLWNHLVSTMLQESPAIGMGYYSASRVLGPQYNPLLGNAHSAFVEILVGGGLLGGFVFLALYAALGVYAVRLFARGRDDPLAFTVIALFTIIFLLSITDTDGIQRGPIGFTFWSLTALLPAVWEQVRRNERTRWMPRNAYPARP